MTEERQVVCVAPPDFECRGSRFGNRAGEEAP